MKPLVPALLISLTIFLIATPKAHAIDPGLEGGSCCQTGFSYRPNTCINDELPSWCNQVANGVVFPMFGFITTNFCNLPLIGPLCTNYLAPFISSLTTNISNSCLNTFVTAGSVESGVLCAQFAEQIEPTIDGFEDLFSFIPGFNPTQLINEFQANCSSILNGYLSALPTTPFLAPQCVNPLNCNTSTGLCEAAGYIATETPYCDYLSPSSGIRTAIGCLSFQSNPLINALLSWAIGISGGIAIILIIIASFQITTATGDPKRLTAGQDLLFSAIAGLILISLSVVLLNFIGVNVLGLAGMGFNI